MTGQLRCFLMSDLEGSNHLWATSREAMRQAVTVLDSTVESALQEWRGTLLKARGEGDSHFAVFALPSDAVMAACSLQSCLSAPLNGLDLRTRIAIHVGEADAIEHDYYGVVVNQTARLRAIAHGGQTVISSVTAALAGATVEGRAELRSLGHHRIRDFGHLEEVFQASAPGSGRSFPPLRTADAHGPALMAVTVVDICGAGRAMQALDDRGVVEVNLRWAATMRHLRDLHGACSLKLAGDGCIAAFEDPLDCLAFVQDFRASVALEGLELKAGIDVGRVELTDGEIVGAAVYRAARLRRDAVPGEIALSRLTSDLVGVSGCEGSRDRLGSSPDRASVP